MPLRIGEPSRRRRVYGSMGRCRSTDEAKSKDSESSLAKALAPEEIRRGDFVTPLYVISEWPSWFWDEDALHSREEPVRICSTPAADAEAMLVRRVCLPFVLVKTPTGDERTLDVRKCRLARLERKFADDSRRASRKASKRLLKMLRRIR
jgi:hypothetical protein